MVSLNQVDEQLKRVGCYFRFWGRDEIHELCKVLMPDETIAQAVNGRYENGFAMLVITDHRLLLIDKKPLFLALEDIRFDMISEIDYGSQLFEGTIKIITPNRKLVFTSWSQDRLRKTLNYTQQRVSDIRQHSMQRQFQPQMQSSTEYTSAPLVGEMALSASAQYVAPTMPMRNPINPYTAMPLTLRRRRVPKFY